MHSLVNIFATLLIIMVQPVYGVISQSLMIQDALEPGNPEILKYLAFLSDPVKLSNFDSVIRHQRQVIFKSSYQDLPVNLRSSTSSDKGPGLGSVSEENTYYIHVEVDEPPEPKSLNQLPKPTPTYFPPLPTETNITESVLSNSNSRCLILSNCKLATKKLNLQDSLSIHKPSYETVYSNIHKSIQSTNLFDSEDQTGNLSGYITDNNLESTQSSFSEEILSGSSSNIETTSAKLQNSFLSAFLKTMPGSLNEKQFHKNPSLVNKKSGNSNIAKPTLPSKPSFSTSFISFSLPSSTSSFSSSPPFHDLKKSKNLQSIIPTLKPHIITPLRTTQKPSENSFTKRHHTPRKRFDKPDGKTNTKSVVSRPKIFALNFPPGEPGTDFPTYESIPTTGFDCSEKLYKGYFADEEAGCQVFHVCWGLGQRASFLCPVGTLFSQRFLVCDWWRRVDCSRTMEFQETETTPFGAMAHAFSSSRIG